MKKRKKILIIDDDEQYLNYLKKVFSEQLPEYSILPTDIIQMMKAFDTSVKNVNIADFTRKQIKENYDEIVLIISDIKFGAQEKGGNDLIKKIRKYSDSEMMPTYLTAIIPIIALTQYPEKKSDIIDDGASLSLLKPDKSDSNKSAERELISTIKSQITLFNNQLELLEYVSYPPEIKSNIIRFKNNNKEKKTAFIMSSFSSNHTSIINKIKEVLGKHNIEGVIANTNYHDNLLNNIKVHMHGCDFGIGVFTHIDNDNFNPNVSLEVGYMMALNKHVLLLKEKHFERLQSDLDGLLWKQFDAYNLDTIEEEVVDWLKDKNIID